MEISNDILEKLKNRLHILDEESDENLIEMIVSSIVKLKIHVVNLILIQMNKRES